MNATQIFVWGTVWTALWGSIVWFGKDKITDRRERKTRKRHFLAFLNVWEAEIVADRPVFVSLPPGAQIVGFGKIANQFDFKRLQLVEKATELEANYRRS